MLLNTPGAGGEQGSGSWWGPGIVAGIGALGHILQEVIHRRRAKKLVEPPSNPSSKKFEDRLADLETDRRLDRDYIRRVESSVSTLSSDFRARVELEQEHFDTMESKHSRVMGELSRMAHELSKMRLLLESRHNGPLD